VIGQVGDDRARVCEENTLEPASPTSNVSALESPSLENDTGTIQASKTLVSAASGPVPMACRTSGSNSTQLSSRLL
jgi:hypothetical protein